MKRSMLAIACAALLVLGVTGRAQAQAEHYGPSPIEFNAHVGALFLDTPEGADSDTDPMYGIRLGYNTPSGFGLAGNLDWVPGERNLFGSDVDVNTWLYSGEINYTFGSGGRIHPFVAAGVGAATRTFSDLPDDDDDIESQTDLMIPFGGGIKWFSQSNRWGIRTEIRDNMVLLTDVEDVEEGDEDTEATHNVELSGGISFFFGS
ncbi:MAG TPA: outer membrane beta-barrel protein [Gemmatimonadota bacterium]|nr:outer membrane beta-barrel protein [Gemmatimonadota bacterium]